MLFNYLLPVLRDCVALLNVYQNCPDVVVLVLEFYVDLVDSQIAFQGEVSVPLGNFITSRMAQRETLISVGVSMLNF